MELNRYFSFFFKYFIKLSRNKNYNCLTNKFKNNIYLLYNLYIIYNLIENVQRKEIKKLNFLKTVKISDIRKNIAEHFTDVVYNNKIVVLSRYDKEKAFLLGEKVLDNLLKSNLFNSIKKKTEIINEEDGTFTVAYEPLDLLTNQESYDEAIDDLVDQAKEYAEEFLNNIDLYTRDESRKKHLPLLLFISKACSDEEIKKIMNF